VIARKIVDSILIAPGLDKTEISILIIVLSGHLMLKIYLEPILAIIPRYFTCHSFESAFFANSEEWFESRSVERSLEIHILDVEVNELAPLRTFNCKIKPCPVLQKVILTFETYLNPVYL
jgi:hypothetical protein